MTPGASLDSRAEMRQSVCGNVVLVLDHLELKMAGQLVDVSLCGYRVRHGPVLINPEKTVLLRYLNQAVKVRAMWSRAVSGRMETGFLREEVLLIRNLQAGDHESLLQLVSPYTRGVQCTIRSIVRNQADAEEVIQESLLKVLAHADQFHPGQSFKAWLLQIATNEALRYVRKNRKHAHSLPQPHLQHDNHEEYMEQFADPGESPAQVLERKEFQGAVAAALGSLHEMYREVFVLRDLKHLGMSDVAAQLGIKVDTAHTRLHRARLLMRKELVRFRAFPADHATKGRAET